MNIIWSFFEIFLNFHDSAFLLSVPTKNNEKKVWVKKWHLIAYYLGTVAFFCLFNFITEFSPISAYVFVLPTIFYTIIFFQGSWANRLFWGVFPYALLICIEISGSIVVMKFFQVSLDLLFASSVYRLVMAVSSKIIVFLFWRVLCKKNFAFSSLFPYNLLTAICVSIIILSISMMLWMDPVTNRAFADVESLLLIFALFCLCLLVFMTYRTISQTKEKYTISFVKSYSRTHDFRNNVLRELQPLWGLRYNKKIVNDPQYRAAFAFMDDLFNNDFKTGNEYVDGVLLLHEAEAFDAGILLSVEGKISALNPIKIGDICFLLDQILNTAVQKMQGFSDPEAPKTILLKIIDNQEELIFKLENPSWREDKAFDLTLILDVVKKYKGSVETSVEDLYRTTTISLSYPHLISI